MKSIFFLYSFVLLICFSSCQKGVINSTSCPVSVLIDTDLFEKSSSDEFEYKDVQIEKNCLAVTISYGGGCAKIETQLLSKNNNSVKVSPLELKFVLTDNDNCEKLIIEKFYFDLTPIQVKGQNKVVIKLEKWKQDLIYQY